MKLSKNAKLYSVLIFTLLLSSLSFLYISKAQDVEKIEAGTIVVGAGGTEMVYAPATTFTMGIDSETLRSLCLDRGEHDPDRCVQIITEDTGATNTYSTQISSFWIDRYEVTINQFVNVCTSNYIWFPEGCVDRQLPPEFTARTDQPQVGVSYLDAIAFCGARGARLLTEEEWEYAASGPDKLIFPWGDEFNEDYVHSSDDPFPPKRTYPVGSVPSNQSWIGVYDMAGNAAEWVEQRFLPRILMGIFPEGLPNTTSFRVEIARTIKGGSWDGRSWPMTTFYRESAQPEEIDSHIGFRCARSLSPES